MVQRGGNGAPTFTRSPRRFVVGLLAPGGPPLLLRPLGLRLSGDGCNLEYAHGRVWSPLTGGVVEAGAGDRAGFLSSGPDELWQWHSRQNLTKVQKSSKP